MNVRIESKALDRAYLALQHEVKNCLQYRNSKDADLRKFWREEIKLDLAALREIKAARRKALEL
jgi:hypothetical protein